MIDTVGISVDHEQEAKAQQGKADALFDMGRLDEAASAYRAAALGVPAPVNGMLVDMIHAAESLRDMSGGSG